MNGVRLLTIEEAAEILHVSRPRAYSLARTGMLPIVRIGRQVRVSEESLAAWVQAGGQALRANDG